MGAGAANDVYNLVLTLAERVNTLSTIASGLQTPFIPRLAVITPFLTLAF